ncbi:hypothetical protein GCM10020295_70300 [Streptomyces cinereospinus]
MIMHNHGFERGHGHGGHRHGRGDADGRRAAFGPFGPGGHGFGPGGPGGGFGGFGPGPWGGRGRGGPRGRARRGDVRASILALLKDRPMHGYEMIQEIAERSGGAWKPSPGSVYPTLQLLEDEGLIASESEGGKKSCSRSPRRAARRPGKARTPPGKRPRAASTGRPSVRSARPASA